MRLFGNTDPGEEERKARDEASRASILAGGLPLNALDRLKEQAERGTTFSSNFSVNEFLLTRECGFEPVGQVMGSCAYHVGWWGNQWMTGEIAMVSDAYNEARRLAMNRMSLEAKLLGASGVVGVRIETELLGALGGTIEFKAIGTAVKRIGEETPPETEPFTSGLSGQDHWTLLKTGYDPCGFVMETCAYMCYANWKTSNALGWSWQNQELGDYTQSVYAAREIAMTRLEQHAKAQGGDGIVGVDFETEFDYEPADNNRPAIFKVHFHVSGTVVRKHGYWAKTDQPKQVLTMLD